MSSEEFHVFVSYQSEDRGWVLRLKDALERKGLKVWFDQKQIQAGERFAEALERGVLASRAVVFVISSASFRSEWVKDEYYYALSMANDRSRRKRLVPVLLDKTPAPGFLSSRQHIDFSDSRSFDDGVTRLCAALDGDPASAMALDTTATREPGLDLKAFLQRHVEMAERKVIDAVRLRAAALPASGVVAAGFGATMVLSGSPWWWLTAALVPPLVGWGVTAPSLARFRLDCERSQQLRLLVEDCGGSVEDGCVKVRKEVWRLALTSAGVGET